MAALPRRRTFESERDQLTLLHYLPCYAWDSALNITFDSVTKVSEISSPRYTAQSGLGTCAWTRVPGHVCGDLHHPPRRRATAPPNPPTAWILASDARNSIAAGIGRGDRRSQMRERHMQANQCSGRCPRRAGRAPEEPAHLGPGLRPPPPALVIASHKKLGVSPADSPATTLLGGVTTSHRGAGLAVILL